jgi:transcriptional regulator with XRE-family HTH domain
MRRLPDDPKWHFAARVVGRQRDRGLSNETLAELAKLDPGELGEILRAEGRVGLDTIFLLAGALGVEPGELLEGIAWVPEGEEGGGGYVLDGPGG